VTNFTASYSSYILEHPCNKTVTPYICCSRDGSVGTENRCGLDVPNPSREHPAYVIKCNGPFSGVKLVLLTPRFSVVL
jgi:hypothetical protein